MNENVYVLIRYYNNGQPYEDMLDRTEIRGIYSSQKMAVKDIVALMHEDKHLLTEACNNWMSSKNAKTVKDLGVFIDCDDDSNILLCFPNDACDGMLSNSPYIIYRLIDAVVDIRIDNISYSGLYGFNISKERNVANELYINDIRQH